MSYVLTPPPPHTHMLVVVPDAAMTKAMCGPGSVNGTSVEDPTVPLLGVNAYGWYLAVSI